MIVLDDLQRVVSEGSSKGNQEKFYKDGFWYKVDNRFCSEGLVEDFISKFCECIYDFPFVKYRSEQFSYRDNILTGCYSYSMYSNPDIVFISLRRLLKQYNVPLSIVHRSEDISQNIRNTVDFLQLHWS